eukprot:5261975-Alexandrium_andersonii.AAC.1
MLNCSAPLGCKKIGGPLRRGGARRPAVPKACKMRDRPAPGANLGGPEAAWLWATVPDRRP